MTKQCFSTKSVDVDAHSYENPHRNMSSDRNSTKSHFFRGLKGPKTDLDEKHRFVTFILTQTYDSYK